MSARTVLTAHGLQILAVKLRDRFKDEFDDESVYEAMTAMIEVDPQEEAHDQALARRRMAAKLTRPLSEGPITQFDLEVAEELWRISVPPEDRSSENRLQYLRDQHRHSCDFIHSRLKLGKYAAT